MKTEVKLLIKYEISVYMTGLNADFGEGTSTTHGLESGMKVISSNCSKQNPYSVYTLSKHHTVLTRKKELEQA
jgi:hypothetical protein